MNSRNFDKKMETNEYENEFLDFLLKKIDNSGGSMQLQHITGYFSELRKKVRSNIGTSMWDLRIFLMKHQNLFCIDNNDVVSLANSSTLTTSGYDSDDSNIGSLKNLPPEINKGKGVIVKLFPQYGFIKSKDPIKTEIYFRALDFGDRNIDLTSILYTGANVYFNARKKKYCKSRCKYNATEVWKADNSKPEDNAIVQKSRKNRDTGLYDPLTLDGEGVIQKVFPNLGFIAVNGDDNNTVFFYKSRVVNYDNIVDLTKIFSKGDAVEFNSHRTTKPDAKARWEAIKVWKMSGKAKQNMHVSDGSQCSDKSSLPKQNISTINIRTKEMKKNERGKICPRSHGAVIKFGKNELADGDSALCFISGTQVTDIGWEFSEGDDVFFDAVKIKSVPGWKAVLVWSGIKPDIVLPTCLGDFSEFSDEENNEISSSLYTSKSSSCLSISSSSSIKSMSVKSESISSEKREFKKENSSNLSDDSTNKTTREKKSIIEYLSQNNFQNIGIETKNYSNKLNSAASNRSDSPYSDADSAILPSKHNALSSETEKHIHYNASDEQQNLLRHASSIENSDEEVVNSYELSNSCLKDNIDESKDNKLKLTASIKKFQTVEGKILKVYPKYAEVKSCNLQKTVAFFWNDFYNDGMSVEDLELDDLRQVLEIGDIIYFNYFEIVDDSNQSWQKVSKAWKGSKPKIHIEMSPEDFIKENCLSVTVSDECDLDEMHGGNFTSKKFLTSFTDVVPDQYRKNTGIESCTEDDQFSNIVQDSEIKHNKVAKFESYREQDDSSNAAQTSGIKHGRNTPIDSCTENVELLHNSRDSTIKPIKSLPVRDFKNLSSTICQILKKNAFPLKSKVDLRSISEEIITIVLEDCNKTELKDDCSKTVSKVGCTVRGISDICAKCKEKCVSNTKCQNVAMKDSDVQTIITGEIIAQNIFTEC